MWGCFEKKDPFIYLIVQNADLFIYCPLIFIPIYSWQLDKHRSQFSEYQENKRPWYISERKIYAHTGSEKWGLSHTKQEKTGQSYTFCWKKRANHIPGSAEKGGHYPPPSYPLLPYHESYVAELGFELVIPGSAVRCSTRCSIEPSINNTEVAANVYSCTCQNENIRSSEGKLIHFQVETTLSRFVFPPFWKGIYLKRKAFAPKGRANYFHLELSPFQKRLCFP